MTLTEQREGTDTLVCSANVYSSRMLRAYTAWLSKQKSADILDCGPVCDDTINFFLPHVGKIFIRDIFLRLHRYRDTNAVLHGLDFKPGSFQAIHLWDLLDHIDKDHTSLLIKACDSMIKPGGMVIITSYDESKTEVSLNSFAVNKNYRVILRPQHHLNLPYFNRNNRDINIIMEPFTIVNSYVYTCGVREFCFRKN